jgi:hypothetical protein
MDWDLLSSCGGFFSGAEHAAGLIFLLFGGVVASGAGWAVVRSGKSLLTPGRASWVARLATWKSLRRLSAIPRMSLAQTLAEGAVVRLQGIVEGDEMRPAALSAVPSVVCQHAVGEPGGGTVSSGLLASDFKLRLQDGTLVTVFARGASLHGSLKLIDGSPHRWTARLGDVWFCESRVRTGDQIEVVGQLQRQVDANIARANDRAPALGWTLGGACDELLLSFATAAGPERLLAGRPAEI